MIKPIPVAAKANVKIRVAPVPMFVAIVSDF